MTTNSDPEDKKDDINLRIQPEIIDKIYEESRQKKEDLQFFVLLIGIIQKLVALSIYFHINVFLRIKTISQEKTDRSAHYESNNYRNCEITEIDHSFQYSYKFYSPINSYYIFYFMIFLT